MWIIMLILLLLGAQLNLTAIVPLQTGDAPPPWWVGGRLLWPFAVETHTLLPAGDLLNASTPILAFASAACFVLAAAALLRWIVPERWFRWLILRDPSGWVEILQYNDRLAFLRGPDGAYDLLWRELRESGPPAPDDDQEPEAEFLAWHYHRQGVWEQLERHEAEQHNYARGGGGGELYPGLDAVHRRYLTDRGIYQG